MRLQRPDLHFVMSALALVAVLATPALAQEAQPEGKDIGNYHVNQSIELGWRGTSITGNNDVYDTFVNLGQGVRLLNQTLEMRSLDHHGLLFDNLFMNSFGYGGDPNDFTLLRVSKNQWYNFNATFRRDRNLWNYDLLANPLNPTTSKPSDIIDFSPHGMALTRRMSDYNLTLFPESRVRFRLDYARNINEGPSLTTYHVGTEALLFQDWKTTTNAYQVGVDFKILPKTNISYDQFLTYYKGDTSWTDNHLLYELPNGQLVDLGVSFDTGNNSPCRTPVSNPTTTPPTANPACNGFTNYSRSEPVRTSYPTEQLTFQSNYFKNVDMSGRLVYTKNDARVLNFQESFQGFESRTLARELDTSGGASIERVSTSADYAVTFAITPKFRIVDEFRWIYFRIPGENHLSTAALFGASMGVAPIGFSPATCPPPYTASTCPPHNGSSEADNATALSSLFLGDNTQLNSLQFEYDFTKHFGGRLGYRYRHRLIDSRDVATSVSTYDPVLAPTGPCQGQPLNPDGSCTLTSSSGDSYSIPINEHSLLFGLWSTPTDKLRLSYDQELMYADNTFARISPRQLQHYKLRGNLKATKWATVNGTVNIYEARNNVSQIDHLEHTRNYALGASIAPREKWSLDFGYDHTDIFSQTNICFALSAKPAPVFPTCAIPGSPVTLEGISLYSNRLHYGYADLMLKPVHRVTMSLGYAIDSVVGSTLILNPNSPPGPLNYNYHRPYGSIAVDLAKGWTGKVGWGFYDYNELEAAVDPIGSRSFRGNLATVSVVYAF